MGSTFWKCIMGEFVKHQEPAPPLPTGGHAYPHPLLYTNQSVVRPSVSLGLRFRAMVSGKEEVAIVTIEGRG